MMTQALRRSASALVRQRNTLRDALIASINLDIFIKDADRMRMSAIATIESVSKPIPPVLALQ